MQLSLMGLGLDSNGLLCVLDSGKTQPKNQVPVLRALANFFYQASGAEVAHAHRNMVRQLLGTLSVDDVPLGSDRLGVMSLGKVSSNLR